MINELLWLAGAKQQHDIQKASGLAGIVGILAVIFVAVKWQDWFYPLFKKIGVVDLAHHLGLVRDGFPAMTVIYIVLFLCFCFVLIGLFCLAMLIGGLLLMLIGQSKVGVTVLAIMTLPFLFPFMLRVQRQEKKKIAEEEANGYYRPVPFQKAYSKDKELSGLLKKYKKEFEHVRMFRLFEEQTKRENGVFEVWYDNENWELQDLTKAQTYLNRAVASVEHDQEWLFGYQKEYKAEYNKFYLFLPNPLPAYASQHFLDDHYKDGSLVSTQPFSFDSTGEEIYQYPLSEVRRNPENLDKGIFYVPAIEIEFVWDGHAITPKIKDGAEVQSIELRFKKIFQIKSPIVDKFFNEVSQSKKVQQAIKEAHIAMYLIPMAYTNTTREGYYGYTGYFNEAVAQIPNTLAFAPLYAADVQERIVRYAKNNKQWAIDWLKQDV